MNRYSITSVMGPIADACARLNLCLHDGARELERRLQVSTPANDACLKISAGGLAVCAVFLASIYS